LPIFPELSIEQQDQVIYSLKLNQLGQGQRSGVRRRELRKLRKLKEWPFGQSF